MKSHEMREWLGCKTNRFVDDTTYSRLTRKQLEKFTNLNKAIKVLDSNLYEAVLLKPRRYDLKIERESANAVDSIVIVTKVDPDLYGYDQYLVCVKDGLYCDSDGTENASSTFYKITVLPNNLELDSCFIEPLEFLSNNLEWQRPYYTITTKESEQLRTLVREIRHTLCYDSQGKLSKSMELKTINHVRISIMHLYFWNEDQKVVKIDLDYSSNRNPNAVGAFEVKLSILYNHNTNTLLWAEKKGTDYQYIDLSLDGVVHFFYYALYGCFSKKI